MQDGSLMLYTSNGIVVFNGFAFKPLIADSSYKKQFFRKLIYIPATGHVMGCDMNKHLFQLFPLYRKINLGKKNAYNFARKGDSLILLTGDFDLFVYSIRNNKVLDWRGPRNYMNAFPKNFTPTQMTDYEDHVFIASSQGLFRINPDSGTVQKLMETPCDQLRVSAFTNRLYISSGAVIYSYNGKTIEKVADLGIKPTKNQVAVTAIEFLDTNRFFAGTPDGVILVTKSGMYNISAPYKANINSLYFDKANACLFAGTGNKGLLKLQFKENFYYSEEAGLHNASLNSIVDGGHGEIVFARNCCYLQKLVGDTVLRYSEKQSNYASLSNIGSHIWAGTWGSGIYIFNKGQLIDSLKHPSLPGNEVHACYQTKEGNIWIGTDKGLASGADIKHIKPAFPQIKETVICFYEKSDGAICVGAVGCFYIIKNGKITHRYDDKKGLRGKEVRTFYEDEKKRLWIGTYGGGLYCLNSDRFVSINAKRGCMLDEDVFCLAPDGLGFFYITSNHGLWRVSLKALFDFYEDRLNYLVPYHYAEENGIANTEFTGGFQNNFLKMQDGSIYFPGIGGLLHTIVKNPYVGKLSPIINSIYVNDTLFEAGSPRLDHNTHSIRFNFSCNSIVTHGNVYFQYRLFTETGSEWNAPQKSRSVTFDQLRHGKYRFVVRAIDGSNNPNPESVSYEFDIPPFYYETLWFKTMVALIALGLLFTVVRLRIRQIRNRAEEKAHYSRKLAEIELKAIQAQLNPHFIFNCLNTIKFFIIEKDFLRASQSLGTFSSLIRASLENSDKLFVPFKTELKFVKDYIELEKFRLGERLDCTIVSNPSVKDDMLVPYLIIQPHVENAIKHGIANLINKQGKLSLYFERSATGLTCVINDNGIGREASRQLNQRSARHISKGTQLIVEKSEFLRQYNNYNCSIEIIDLFTEQGKPAGTKVTIEMPLQ